MCFAVIGHFSFCYDGYTFPQLRVLQDFLCKAPPPALHHLPCFHSFPTLRNRFKLLVKSFGISLPATLSPMLIFPISRFLSFSAYSVGFPTLVNEHRLLSSVPVLSSHPICLFPKLISFLPSPQSSIVIA